MGALWLPSDDELVVAQREPNLLVPGRKPVGPVEIDRTTAIGASLVHCILTNAYVSHDLAGGAVATADPNCFVGVDDSGQYVQSVLNGSWNDYGITLSGNTNTVQDVSHFVAGRYMSSGGTKRANLVRGTSGITLFGGKVCWMYGGTTRLEHSATIASGNYFTVGGHYTSSEKVLCVDGAVERDNPTGYTIAENIANIINHPDGNGRYVGRSYIFMSFNRILDDDEYKMLAANPYLCLRPANQSSYLISIPATYPTLSAVEAAAYSASSITPRCDIEYP